MGRLWSYHGLTLTLFTLISAYAHLVAGQANRTVDDFSSLVSYSAAEAVTHLDTTGFDVTRLNNRTVAVMNSAVSPSISMTMKFTGTALWLFLAKPATTLGSTSTASYTIFLDGAVVLDVGQTPLEADAVYSAVAYSNTSLHLGAHEVILRINDGGTAYFDYAVFTSDNPNPETSIAPLQPSASTGTPESAATGGKPKRHVAVIAGAVTGGVLLLLSACLAMLLLRRRRRRRGIHPRPMHNSPQRIPAQTSKEPVSSGSTDKLMVTGGGTASSTLPLVVSHPPEHLPAQIQEQPHTLEYKPSHEYNEDSLKPDSVTGTSDSDPDAAIQRMLAEQREIMAEHERPDPAAWCMDGKKAPFTPQTLAPAPPSTSLAHSTSPGNSESASTAGRHPDPEMSSIAAQMRALQAQMARLEVERGTGRLTQSQYPEEGVPPPAYAGI